MALAILRRASMGGWLARFLWRSSAGVSRAAEPPIPSPEDQQQSAYATFWGAMRSLDADAAASQFATGALFSFGNAPPAVGLAGIRAALIELFTGIASISQRTVTSWRGRSLVVAESDLSIAFDDGRTMTIPATTMLWSSARGIEECRVLLHSHQPAVSGFPSSGVSRPCRVS